MMLKMLKPVTFVLFLSLTTFSAWATPTNKDDESVKSEKTITKEEFEAASQKLYERVQQLKVAKENATTKEEKALIKQEIKGVKAETKALKEQAVGGGVYIGGGALIVILIVLLIVLL